MRRLFFILMSLCVASLSPATIVKIEAEDSSLYYVSGNWSTETDPEASGGQYITAIINGTTENPAYTRYYAFNVPAGTYNLYMRINMSSDGGIAVNDSFYHSDSSFAEDAAMRLQNNTAGTGIDDVSTTDNWGWLQIDTGFVSTGGSVVFKLSTREDGCGIDAIAFVTADETVTDELLNTNPLAPYDPVVTPENEDGSVGTLEYDGQYQVSDVVLSFKAGKDPDETYAVNPDILRHNIWLQSGLPADANMVLIDSIDQTTLDDPNQTVALSTYPIILVDNTTFQWQVEEVLDNGAGGYGVGDPNNIMGPLWSFTTASAVPVIESISDEVTTDTNGDAILEIVVTDIADHFQWFQVVGEQDSAENGEADDIMLLDSDPLYEGVTTTTLQITGAASDGSDDAQVYAIAYNGAPGGPITEVSDPSPARWFWYPRLMSHYPFEVVNVGNVTPDVESGYNMTLMSGDAGTDVPSLHANIPSAPGSTSTTSLFFNNPLGADPNANAEYGLISEPSIGRYRDITISAWVFPKGGLFNQRIIDFGEQDNWIYLTPESDGNVFLMNVIGQTVTAPALSNGEWTFITATLRGDTGRLYVNGQFAASAEITNDPISIGTIGLNYVGRSNNPDDAYLNGYIDDLKIYNYGLANYDIAQLYMDDTLEETICDLEAYDLEDFDTNENCVLDLPDLLEMIARWLEDDRIYPAS